MPLEIVSNDKKYSVLVTNIVIKKKESFLDYIFGGCEMGLHVCIDFTMSNGPPSNPQSLHYLDPNKNQYDRAIRAVGQIL